MHTGIVIIIIIKTIIITKITEINMLDNTMIMLSDSLTSIMQWINDWTNITGFALIPSHFTKCEAISDSCKEKCSKGLKIAKQNILRSKQARSILNVFHRNEVKNHFAFFINKLRNSKICFAREIFVKLYKIYNSNPGLHSFSPNNN